MSRIFSNDNLVFLMRAKQRSTGETGTITALEPTDHGTYGHVTSDDSEAVELPSKIRVEYVELDPPAVMVTYCDATLALINGRVSNATHARKEIAGRMG